MTFLPATVQGRWFYLYLILDLYSRKIVGFEVHDTDSADHAAHLARRAALTEAVHAMPVKPVLHGDNGATLKATTVLAMLHWLGIEPLTRGRASATTILMPKHCSAPPNTGRSSRSRASPNSTPRAGLGLALRPLVQHEHRHSGIRYVTPRSATPGRILPRSLLAHELYQQARQANPRRWSGQTRDWTPVTSVTLNPERDAGSCGGFVAKPASGSVDAPAFPSRPGMPRPRRATEGTGGAQPPGAGRAARSRREHGEDGAHRTFPEVSTVAHSAHVDQAIARTW